jgi:RimJ/RimL family protein N-acetyltransferase
MPFELQPVLTGTLVELRPLTGEDFPALYLAASDPLIWEQHPEPDRWTEPVFRRYFDGGMECGGAFAILDRQSGRIIGSSRYYGYDETRSEIEIGWTFLTRPYWGGRYNGEVKALMITHAFRFVERVIFRIGPDNRRSRMAIERIGATEVGFLPDARGHSAVVYAIDRPQPKDVRSRPG